MDPKKFEPLYRGYQQCITSQLNGRINQIELYAKDDPLTPRQTQEFIRMKRDRDDKVTALKQARIRSAVFGFPFHRDSE